MLPMSYGWMLGVENATTSVKAWDTAQLLTQSDRAPDWFQIHWKGATYELDSDCVNANKTGFWKSIRQHDYFVRSCRALCKTGCVECRFDIANCVRDLATRAIQIVVVKNTPFLFGLAIK